MTPIPFEVSTDESDNGVRIVEIRGELDMNTAPELENSLQEATSSRQGAVLINLSDCEFIDSTGVALIVQAWQRLDEAAEGEGRLVLCCPNSQVRRVLDITGVENSISLHDTMDEALASLHG
jgi:anti-anti-sigma factor